GLRETRFHVVSGALRVRRMSRVARLACTSMELVLRLVEQALIMTGDVTCHAAGGVLFRLSMEGEDQLFRRGNLLIVARRRFNALDVSLARSVATFATCAILCILWRRLGMDGFRKCIAMDRMTSKTSIDAGVIASLSQCWRLPHNRRRHVRFGLLLS